MKKVFSVIIAAAVCLTSYAGQPLFSNLGANVGVGTTGVSVELSTPVTNFVQMRAGVSIMPGITFNSDADFSYSAAGVNQNGTASLKGDLGRVQGQVIFNIYPASTRLPLYIALGAYFGGSHLVEITGHSDDLEQYGGGNVIIGDYNIPVDENGNVSGGIKVKSFRPYIGIGWGRAVPGKRVNFSVDLGVQIHGKPELYSEAGEITRSLIDDNNTFNKIMDKVKVYPTLTFRMGFRAF